MLVPGAATSNGTAAPIGIGQMIAYVLERAVLGAAVYVAQLATESAGLLDSLGVHDGTVSALAAALASSQAYSGSPMNP
jgi:hypothetical protein